MSWNEELFSSPEEDIVIAPVDEQEVEIDEEDEPKKRVMFQKAVLQTANAPQIGEYMGTIYNRYTGKYEEHLIKVYAPQPNLYDGLKPAAVGATNPNNK